MIQSLLVHAWLVHCFRIIDDHCGNGKATLWSNGSNGSSCSTNKTGEYLHLYYSIKVTIKLWYVLSRGFSANDSTLRLGNVSFPLWVSVTHSFVWLLSQALNLNKSKEGPKQVIGIERVSAREVKIVKRLLFLDLTEIHFYAIWKIFQRWDFCTYCK